MLFISFLIVESQGGEPVKADTRPDWALFAKVSENMETILFKEKFIDWPDAAKIIKVKGQDDDQDKVGSDWLKSAYMHVLGCRF